jgi:hypothetical protein
MTYDRALRYVNAFAWLIFLASILTLLSSLDSCHYVNDGSDALCLGVTAEHGLCVEWRKRP